MKVNEAQQTVEVELNKKKYTLSLNFEVIGAFQDFREMDNFIDAMNFNTADMKCIPVLFWLAAKQNEPELEFSEIQKYSFNPKSVAAMIKSVSELLNNCMGKKEDKKEGESKPPLEEKKKKQ